MTQLVLQAVSKDMLYNWPMYLLDDNMSLYRMYFCILVLQNTFSHTSMLYFIWIHFMKILFGVFVPISDKKCYDGLIMPLS